MVRVGIAGLIVLGAWSLARADSIPVASGLKQERPLAMQDALANIMAARRNEPAEEPARGVGEKQVGGSQIRPGSPEVLNMLGGLALCCGMFLVMMYVLRRCHRSRLACGSHRMKIVERLALSSKTALLIVEVEGQRQLLSLGAENVAFLGSLSRLLTRKVFMPQRAAGAECESQPAMVAGHKQ